MQIRPPVEVLVLAGAAVVLVLAGGLVLGRGRRNPKERERRRRLAVNGKGRLGDATITDVSGDAIFYEYTVRGVCYTASQDISDLRQVLPGAIEQLVGGAASLKYSPANPANSIVVCEEWSGLRWAQRAQSDGALS